MALAARIDILIGARTKAMEAGFKRSTSLTQRFTRSITKSTKQLLGFGSAAAVIFTAVAGFKAAVASAEGFNRAMASSVAIMGDLNTQTTAAMESAARAAAFGKDFSATDTAKGFFFLASAGLDAAQSIEAIGTATTFAQAGMFDLSSAVDLLTDAQSALGLSVKDVAENTANMTRLGNLLVGANTLANASVEQFSTSLTSKAGAAFKAFNIDLRQGIALLGAFADQGIKGELAGAATDRLLRLLSKAVVENSARFKELNIRIFNARGEFRPFKDSIGDIERALRGMSTEQKIATLVSLGFEARIQAVILPLIGASEKAGEYAEKLGDLGDIMDEVAGKQIPPFTSAMNKLKDILAGVISVTVAPALDAIGESFNRNILPFEKIAGVIHEVNQENALLALRADKSSASFGQMADAARVALGGLDGAADGMDRMAGGAAGAIGDVNGASNSMDRMSDAAGRLGDSLDGLDEADVIIAGLKFDPSPTDEAIDAINEIEKQLIRQRDTFDMDVLDVRLAEARAIADALGLHDVFLTGVERAVTDLRGLQLGKSLEDAFKAQGQEMQDAADRITDSLKTQSDRFRDELTEIETLMGDIGGVIDFKSFFPEGIGEEALEELADRIRQARDDLAESAVQTFELPRPAALAQGSAAAFEASLPKDFLVRTDKEQLKELQDMNQLLEQIEGKIEALQTEPAGIGR